MSIEETIRQSVREEVSALREELLAALAELKPATTVEALLTVEQVAVRAGGVQPETVRGWIRNGRLQAKRAGHRFLISQQALDAFLAGGTKQTALGADEHLSLLVSRVEAAPRRSKK